MTINLDPTSVNPDWTPECGYDNCVTHAMGPSLWAPGIDVYTAWDPHNGPQAYDQDGNRIPVWDLLKYSVAFLRLHSVLLRAQRHHSQKEAQR